MLIPVFAGKPPCKRLSVESTNSMLLRVEFYDDETATLCDVECDGVIIIAREQVRNWMKSVFCFTIWAKWLLGGPWAGPSGAGVALGQLFGGSWGAGRSWRVLSPGRPWPKWVLGGLGWLLSGLSRPQSTNNPEAS